LVERLCPVCEKGTINLGKCRRCGAQSSNPASRRAAEMEAQMFYVKGQGDLADIGGNGKTCRRCGTAVVRRLAVVTAGAHSCSLHCVSCQEIPCFVEGCEQRALIAVPHTTGPSSGNPHWTPPTFPNDICLCSDHHYALSLAQQKGLWYYLSRLGWLLLVPYGLRLIGSPLSTRFRVSRPYAASTYRGSRRRVAPLRVTWAVFVRSLLPLELAPLCQKRICNRMVCWACWAFVDTRARTHFRRVSVSGQRPFSILQSATPIDCEVEE